MHYPKVIQTLLLDFAISQTFLLDSVISQIFLLDFVSSAPSDYDMDAFGKLSTHVFDEVEPVQKLLFNLLHFLGKICNDNENCRRVEHYVLQDGFVATVILRMTSKVIEYNSTQLFAINIIRPDPSS